MEKSWIIALAVGIFLILTFLFYKSMTSFVREKFGKSWLTVWGNKVYFWQSLLFISVACTAFILYLLKWGNVLSF